MIIVIALAIMIFTATASVLSGLRSAPAAFAANEGFAISSSSAPTIFASQVDLSMANALEALPQIVGASPEVFAFSSWNGHSFVLRGVLFDKLNKTGPSFEKFELTGTGRLTDRTSTLIGWRLLDRLGIQLPYTLPVVGSYSSRLEFLNVIGSFKTGSSLDDELLVSLDVARYLTGMSPQKVSIIRVATTDPEWLSSLLTPAGARFTLFDLLTQKSEAAIGEEIGVSVGVRNWGTRPGMINVSIGEADRVVARLDVTLNASESTRVSTTITFDSLGTHAIVASISGAFPVTLTVNVTIVDPYLRIATPARVAHSETFNVTVMTYLGTPAVGARVVFGSQTNFTDADGIGVLLADQTGIFQVTANLTGFTDAVAAVRVDDPSTYPLSFQPVISSFTLSPDKIRESESATGVVMASNNGSIAGTFNVTVLVDSASYTVLTITLKGLGSTAVNFNVMNLSPGTHAVQVGNFSYELVVESWIVDNPDLVQLVMRYSGSSSLFAAGSVPIYQAAKISEGNVSVALFAIGAISALLALLAITSVFSKEIREARRRLGILKTIGASRSAIRKLVFPQALETGLGGAAIGVAFGVILADWISKSGMLVLFGHSFTLDLNTTLLVLILIGAVGISIVSALASAMIAARETAIKSIRKLQEEAGELIDVQKLIGEE